MRSEVFALTAWLAANSQSAYVALWAQSIQDLALSAQGAAFQRSINVAIGTECKWCAELDISNSRLIVLS